MIPIHHILHTLMGESARAGLRCAVVRTFGCNLACRWCDTPQAHVTPRSLGVGDIADIVAATRAPIVLLTGGEPLIHEEAGALCERLLALGLEVVVETNGSRDLSGLPGGVVKVMDIKPPSSGFEGTTDMRNLLLLGDGDEVKLVVADREDYLWARTTLRERLAGCRAAVNLSPLMTGGMPSLVAQWMVEDALEARLNLQLHKILFPAGEHEVF